MKIGFCGAASTGKTTVAMRLQDMIAEDYKPSIVRGVMEKWGLNEQTALRLSPEDRLRLQLEIFEAKCQQDHIERDGIFDRTLIDQLAYLLIKCNEIVSDSIFAEVRKRAMENLRTYDLIYYFPICRQLPFTADGFRVSGEGYRVMQDMIMHGFLNESRMPYRPLTFNTPERRAEIIKKRVDEIRVKRY